MQPLKQTTHAESEQDDYEVFDCKDEMRKSIRSLCFGDLYIIGNIWINILKAVLVGAKLSLIPVVNAAEPKEPQKPPPMRFKELPIYKSPHREYNEFEADRGKCEERNVKLLHRALIPHVTEYRKKTQSGLNRACCAIRSTSKDLCNYVENSKKDFKSYMRCPDNLQLRQGVVATGTLTGFLLGGGGGIPRRLIYTSIGALSTGALCFPKETDEYFRTACYHTAKFFTAIYNSTCGKEFSLRERLPCKDDMPPPPPYRKPICPQK